MLNDLGNLNLNKFSNKSNDAQKAKNIIDKLFIFVHSCVRGDEDLNIVVKSVTLKSLPGIAKSSREYVDKLNKKNPMIVKKLLEDIRREL